MQDGINGGISKSRIFVRSVRKSPVAGGFTGLSGRLQARFKRSLEVFRQFRGYQGAQKASGCFQGHFKGIKENSGEYQGVLGCIMRLQWAFRGVLGCPKGLQGGFREPSKSFNGISGCARRFFEAFKTFEGV